MPGFTLPDPPPELATKPVRAWSAPVTIPTYLPLPPDKNPMFLEKRVYQGSSGKVYPLPFIDRISTEKIDRAWQAIHIENEFVRLMILPELGGRIHVGLDKTNNYDFFYRQNVIKPALVGLAGPWISGGVEFNWPQHHRPSTFMPVDTHIEEHSDGSVTVWCSEHEPMTRMKGTHGIHLKPASSLIELKVRLYNRTELPQTFLWWANVAARVHEHYQSFFPPDVQFVADHAKRAMSRFPLCDGTYYGINYAARAAHVATRGNARQNASPAPGSLDSVPTPQNSGLTSQGLTSQDSLAFPPSNYPPNDLTRYANIPVPTSYMILGTKEDFFGGYDHHAQAGFVHVADHHISPGKKQWTWGNHPFGYAWDRNLTDPDDPNDTSPPYRRHLPAPYIELMAGVFTDNQPDFSYLMPGETRTFSQFWYPLQKIGPAQKANTRAALSLTPHPQFSPGLRAGPNVENASNAQIGLTITSTLNNARLELHHNQTILFQKENLTLTPGIAFLETIPLPPNTEWTNLRLVLSNGGDEILTYQPEPPTKKELPEPAKEPPLPQDVQTAEELYLIGLHLEQYRHATRLPETYWREALKRDPHDARCHNALGLHHLRRGEFGKAVTHFQTAIATLTKYNPNPRDGEAFYNLGIALRYLNRMDEAYEAFGKAVWDKSWQGAAYFAMGQLDSLNGNWERSLMQLDASLSANPLHAQARNLKVLVLRRSGQKSQAEDCLDENKKHDALDLMARFLNSDDCACNGQVRMDLALECCKAGFWGEATDALDDREWDRTSWAAQHAPADPTWKHSSAPLSGYYLGYFTDRGSSLGVGMNARRAAALAPPDYCFPHRLEEIAILQDAITKNPEDPRAPYYLGNLLYDKRRHDEAITLWEKSARLDSTFPTVWRNLGLAYYNILHDPLAAKGAYQKAFKNSLTWGQMERESPDSPSASDTQNSELRTQNFSAPEPALPSEHTLTGMPAIPDQSPHSAPNQKSKIENQKSPPGDARILYERDQLWKRTQEAPESRIAELEKYPHLVRQRDDLTIEYCTLLNQLRRHDEALTILKFRRFQPWEGGEGLVLGQWARTHLALGRKALWLAPSEGGNPRQALALFQAALNPPENLGEAWHPLQNNSELHYWAGIAAKSLDRQSPDWPPTMDHHATDWLPNPQSHFQIAARSTADFQSMAVRDYSEASYWSALALIELARPAEARTLLEAMLTYAEKLKTTQAKIDYFATSLPTMLLFEDDIQAVQNRHATLLQALALHGLSGAAGKDRKTARRLLNDLLAENPSHALAADLMLSLDWGLG